jgi:hypothetical protein
MTLGSLKVGRPFYKKKDLSIKEQHKGRDEYLHPSREKPEYGRSDSIQTTWAQ